MSPIQKGFTSERGRRGSLFTVGAPDLASKFAGGGASISGEELKAVRVSTSRKRILVITVGGPSQKKEAHLVASRTVVEYTDDLDGGKADGTKTFALDGTQYEIDLSRKNAVALEKVLAPYVAAARRVSSTRSTARRGAGRSTRSDLDSVRQWARDNGYTVADRGRVAQSVIDAYDTAAG
jgi:hypothetical protein